jgi:exopolyphosphatase/guanosine-5'-triphosphate,3'-diphosphate pyrophosphatase
MTIDQHIAAGIDLGSNTFRLLVAICSAGNLSVLDKKLVTVRLGRGLAENKILHERAMEKGLEVLRIFRKSLDHYQPQSIRVCGTEALRQAANSYLFLRNAEEILQSKIDIISDAEEAHLNLAGALSGYREPLSGTFLLVDVGGGSTELLFADQTTGQTGVESIGLGVIGLTEKFLTASQPNIAAMDAILADTIGSALEKLSFPGKLSAVNIIGCGGTATSLAALDLNLISYNESLVHAHILLRNTMEELWSKLIVLPADRRNELPCLGEGRGEILPAGLRIYQMLLKLIQQDRIRVSDTGLLEGILLSSISDIPSLNCSQHNLMPKS